MPRPKVWRHPRILTEHVFDKLWHRDCTLAEFRTLLDARCDVIEVHVVADSGLKQILLSGERVGPLPVVLDIDDAHEEERVITVDQPSAEVWADDFRVRC